MTRRELEAKVRQLEDRERARTAAAREQALAKRRGERLRLARQVRLVPEGVTSQLGIVRHLREEFGWRTSPRTVAAILRDG